MKEVAQVLCISPRTVETIINNAKAKVECHTTSDLLRIIDHSYGSFSQSF
jgi:DNA-binding CsgD family transcriptional regulator